MARRDSVLVSRSMYQIGVATLVAAIAWVMLGIYLTITQSVSIDVDKKMTDPLVTTIDNELLEQLTARLPVDNLVPENLNEPEIGSESGVQEPVVDDTIEVGSENELTN